MNADEAASDAKELRFAWLLVAAFVLLTIPRLFFHELWRDEAWLWLVVRESRGLSDLFTALGRSGQGYLFPLLCVLAGQVSPSPRALQVLHLFLAASAAFVFARYAPLPRRERVLFLLGYFPFYEYAVISRHYVAGALLTWLACTVARSGRRTILLAGLLALLCQTTVYGFILAMAIACGWHYDRWLRRRELPALSLTEMMASVALVAGGGIAGLVQLVPASGTSFAPGWFVDRSLEHAGATLAMVWRAFVPLPHLAIAFWNSNVLDPWPGLEAAAGLLTLGLAVSLLWRRKVALVTFLAGAAGVLLFGYAKYIGVMRHQGHLWLLFMAAVWLGTNPRSQPRHSWRERAVLAILGAHCLAGLYASWIDLRHPFSNGPATAELIRSEGLDRFPLLGHREPPAAAVALPLGRPLYSPSRRMFTTHPDWGPEQREMSDGELRCAARALARTERRDVVLVINRELPPWEELVPAGFRVGGIAPTEDFHLYRMPYGALDASAGAAGCGDR